jgi:hypothetical protein
MKHFVLLLLLIGQASCDSTDPYLREGVWRPSGVNAGNLRAMVSVPSDLLVATRPARGDGGLAAMSVDRLRHDRVRPLPDSGLARVVPVAGASKSQAPAASPSGGAN